MSTGTSEKGQKLTYAVCIKNAVMDGAQRQGWIRVHLHRAYRSEGLVRKASKPDMEAEAGQPYKRPGPTQLPRGLGTIGYVQSLMEWA